MAQEQLSFGDLLRHLTNQMNPKVEISLHQGKQAPVQRYFSNEATDGGCHPVFSNACATMKVSGGLEPHRAKLVKFRRVCLMEQRYVVLSVYESEGMYEVVAYDSSSYKEYAVRTQKGAESSAVRLKMSEFDLMDDRHWDKLLSTASLGDCLTPCIHVAVYASSSRGQGKELAAAQIPISAACNDPGRDILRSFPLSSSTASTTARALLRLRFYPEHAIASISGVAESKVEEVGEDGDEADFQINAGDEAVAEVDGLEAAEDALVSASDYSLLAQRLRKEVEEATQKLSDSEKSRSKLMDTCRTHERDLLRTRRELEKQQEKLLAAAKIAEKQAPQRPGRSASTSERNEYKSLQSAHEEKLRELTALRRENERLRKETEARGEGLVAEVGELKSRLRRTEADLRDEVSAKKELLLQLEEAAAEAQHAARLGMKRASVGGKSRRTQKKQASRRRQMKQRMDLLKHRLGNQFQAYAGALQQSLRGICTVMLKRRPDNPKKPLAGLVSILRAAGNENGQIAARDMEEVLLDFGVRLSRQEMEMMCTHYDVEGKECVELEDLVDDLETLLPKMTSADIPAHSPAHGSGVQAARSIQDVQAARSIQDRLWGLWESDSEE